MTPQKCKAAAQNVADAQLFRDCATLIRNHEAKLNELYKAGDSIELNGYKLDMRAKMKEVIVLALIYI